MKTGTARWQFDTAQKIAATEKRIARMKDQRTALDARLADAERIHAAQQVHLQVADPQQDVLPREPGPERPTHGLARGRAVLLPEMLEPFDEVRVERERTQRTLSGRHCTNSARLLIHEFRPSQRHGAVC